MNKEQNSSLKSLKWLGFSLNIISLLIYILIKSKAEYSTRTFFNDDSIGFINYAISALYFVVILIYTFAQHRFRFLRMDRALFNYALTLFSISAFAINLSINIFDDFVAWTNIYLVVMYIPLMVTPIWDRLPNHVHSLLYFIMGAGLVMALYFTLFLMPLFPISFVASFLLGLSLHSFAPLFVLIALGVQMYRSKRKLTDNVAIISGVFIPVVICSVFLLKWNQAFDKVHEAHASIITQDDQSLPEWMLLSQRLSDDPITERVIQGGLLYTVEGHWNSGWDAPRTSFQEHRKHDPLVYMCSSIMGELPIDKADRLNILKTKYDQRHLAHRKLWSGGDLSTSQVLTNVELFPEYRLAYTEKIINIRNNRKGWNRQEEAIYTFHLPEGSVATSMSLWIEGVEQKSRLTTKSKADSAYVAIVGVERRDPALLHWQEGNRLTITVFPCTPEEERIFKIGFTTPLKYESDKLEMENIFFEGPHVRSALETVVVRFNDTENHPEIDLPSGFNEKEPGKYIRTGAYNNDWSLSIDAPEIKKNKFSFNGKSYHLENISYKEIPLDVERIFLDVNESWSLSEIEDLLDVSGERSVYVYTDKFIKLTPENYKIATQGLLRYNFSLFPIYKIEKPDEALIITKSNRLSPNLDDLKETKFGSNLEEYLKDLYEPIKMYNIDNELSPFLKSLEEFRVFDVSHGSIDELNMMLQSNTFTIPEIDDNSVTIECSKLKIVKDTLPNSSSNAPDHLMRLFSYKKLMAVAGRDYFDQEKLENEALVEIANEAYIVSPVSSLIVLETQKDYERFDIQENKNSLGNAAVSGSGSVPEPHEWILIGIVGLLLSLMIFKKVI